MEAPSFGVCLLLVGFGFLVSLDGVDGGDELVYLTNVIFLKEGHETARACQDLFLLTNDNSTDVDGNDEIPGSLFLKYEFPPEINRTHQSFLNCTGTTEKSWRQYVWSFIWTSRKVIAQSPSPTILHQTCIDMTEAFERDKKSFQNIMRMKCQVNPDVTIVVLANNSDTNKTARVAQGQSLFLAANTQSRDSLLEAQCRLMADDVNGNLTLQLMDIQFGNGTNCTARVQWNEGTNHTTDPGFEYGCKNRTTGTYPRVMKGEVMIQIKAFHGPLVLQVSADSNYSIQCRPRYQGSPSINWIERQCIKAFPKQCLIVDPYVTHETTTATTETTAITTGTRNWPTATDTPNPTAETGGHEGGHSPSPATVVTGSVVGTLVAVGLAGLAVFCCLRRRKGTRDAKEREPLDAYYTIRDSHLQGGEPMKETHCNCTKNNSSSSQPDRGDYVYTEPTEQGKSDVPCQASYTYTTVVKRPGGLETSNGHEDDQSFPDKADRCMEVNVYNHLPGSKSSREASHMAGSELGEPTMGAPYDTFDTVTGDYAHLWDAHRTKDPSESDLYN